MRNLMAGLFTNLTLGVSKRHRAHGIHSLLGLVVGATCAGAALVSQPVYAAAYVFAGEDNGIDIITHPTNYAGNGGTLDIDVCIVPGSPNAAAAEQSTQNIVRTWNRLRASVGNLSQGNANNVPAGQLDFESVALHELGHCIGLAHVNLASESELGGADEDFTKTTDGANNVFDLDVGADGTRGSNDDLRGDDINLHWFNRMLNDPFDPQLMAIIDATTYARDPAGNLPLGDSSVANAERSVSSLARYNRPGTEAIMQQGSRFGEAQRTLVADDVAGIRLAQSGLDETQGTADDYQVNLIYRGQAAGAPCDVNLSFAAINGLAFCSTGGQFINNNPNHVALTEADFFFNTNFNFFFNDDTNAEADLSVSKVGPAAATAGDTISYTITISNAGPDAAENVLVTDTLPADVTLVSTSGCVEDPAAVPTCSLGNIAAGSSAQYTVTVTIDAGASGMMENTAVAAADSIDLDNGNNSDGQTTTITPVAPCQLSVFPGAVDFGTNTVGFTVTEAVELRNNGSVDCNVAALNIVGDADFLVSASSPATPFVVSNASPVLVFVDFTAASSGAKSADLVINSDSASPLPAVALTGNGAAICDVDGNGQIDRVDTRAIFRARRQTASGPDDRRDANSDGHISTRDARSCARLCDFSRCSTAQPQ